MKLIDTRSAVGHVLCHDMTQIIPGVYKGARFRKGHIVTEEDIPVLLSMGKEHLYVWEKAPGMLHEDEAAERLRALCQNEHMHATEVKEGKIELLAGCDGLFQVDVDRLNALNGVDELMIATRHTNTAVQKGDKLAGMRVIPLVIQEERLREAESLAGEGPILSLTPWKLRTCGLITTGGEVAQGLVQDAFTPVIEEKLSAYGITVTERCLPGDDRGAITAAALDYHARGVDLVLCTGGMSVDPDDRTPGAIRDTGAEIVSYGAPVLPGAMLLLGYFADGVPILGLPGCVMYSRATVFDLLLPRIAAGVRITRPELKALGHGGLCLGCPECHYPICPFGKGD
ncbi:molybdopterin-binding protein [uncultured Intestinimonas sp.]|uniref:molybdopterin-binding protein n=1 Tax=uncultured Intestinimonas sp. TaxID=1689265 RepID=UPI0025DC58C5|nr:molybdopterin-binding protein [uncultured Intestinimonas sp.]